MWCPVFEVHGEFPGHESFGPGQPLAKPKADWPVSVPPAGCPGDPGQVGRQRSFGRRIDCDRSFGRKARGSPGASPWRQQE